MEQCSPDIQEWCKLSINPADQATADAVLFHNIDFQQSLFPKTRNFSQIYVMMTAESPTNEHIHFDSNQINWTMNYRSDADVIDSYILWKPKEKAESIDYDSIWNMKNSSVTSAWMAANCNSANKRRDIINCAASKGLQVDIYGSCGTPFLNCKRLFHTDYSCTIETLGKYKFYYAVENSNCPDYITEKVHNAMMLFQAIPLVLIRKFYEDRGFPPKSLIALDDFGSIEEFAAFVNKLKDDKEEYLSYHKWRETLTLTKTDDSIRFCRLCQMLRAGGHAPKSYENLKEWYSAATCNSSALFHYLNVC